MSEHTKQSKVVKDLWVVKDIEKLHEAQIFV